MEMKEHSSVNTEADVNCLYCNAISAFIDKLSDLSGGLDELFACVSSLFSSVLELSDSSSSFAVFRNDGYETDSKLCASYFASEVYADDEFQPVLTAVAQTITDAPGDSPWILTHTEIQALDAGDSGFHFSALIVPAGSVTVDCGFAAVFYHGGETPHEVGSPRVSFLSKALKLASLACQNEIKDERFSHFLMNDYLTELPNRSYIYESIVYSLQTAEIYGTKFAILIVRVNGLKNINNSLGIVTGDIILKEMGSLIKSAAESDDGSLNVLVGRLSGGDFVVLLTLPADNDDENSIDSILRAYCESINAKTNEYVEISGYKLYLSTNIGVSIYPYHGDTAEDLLRKADLAKNDSKQHGPNTYRFYKELMEGDVERVLFLSSNLPAALSSNQFELFYQALMQIETGIIIGAEALIRWRHPERGLIFPGDFISFSEDNGYSIQIDNMVLDMACRQINIWQDKGYDIAVSVNISPKHFEDGIICDKVSETLMRNSTDPSKLKVELLESILLEDFGVAVNVINSLRALGVIVALDDFGTGHSSLEYIARLPVDYLKIDRSFTMRLDENPINKVVLETIMTLAKGIKVKTVAEGVETQQHFDFLKTIGCDFAQGYFINKPLPVDDFESLLKQNMKNL